MSSKKYFDIIDYEFIENNKDIENTLLDLGYKEVIVYKKINSKKEISNFKVNNLKKIHVKKAFLINDFSLLHFIPPTYFSIGYSSEVSKINSFLSSKKLDFFIAPISEKLIFDEQSSNLLKQNNIKLVFNINRFRDKNNYKAIKQSYFILDLLVKKQVDFCFSSFSKKYYELVDINILKAFLKNFNINQELIIKSLSLDDLL